MGSSCFGKATALFFFFCFVVFGVCVFFPVPTLWGFFFFFFDSSRHLPKLNLKHLWHHPEKNKHVTSVFNNYLQHKNEHKQGLAFTLFFLFKPSACQRGWAISTAPRSSHRSAVPGQGCSSAAPTDPQAAANFPSPWHSRGITSRREVFCIF